MKEITFKEKRATTRMASITTPALFGESCTDSLISSSIGEPPNPSPSIRMTRPS